MGEAAQAGRLSHLFHRSEAVLERELHLTYGSVSRCDPAKLRAAKIRIRQTPGRVVQEVERLLAEL